MRIAINAMISNDVTNPPIRWAAVVHGVKEVMLTGLADLSFWREALQPQGLIPFDAGGSAELTISAPRLVWKGMHFCEWSLGVAVAERDGAAAPSGLFLAHAFNSSAPLAYAFKPGVDALELAPAQAGDVFAQLRDSRFMAREWHVRHDATHRKSRTLSD
jgi:hypothetical protein